MSPTINDYLIYLQFSIYLLFFGTAPYIYIYIYIHTHTHTRQVCWAFYEVRTTLAKFCLHAGDIKFSTPNDEWITSCIIICIILPCIFQNIICNATILIIRGATPGNSQPSLGHRGFSTFLQNESVCLQKQDERKTIPAQAYYRPTEFQEVENPRFPDNRHMQMVRLSALRTGRLYPPGIFPVLSSVSNHSATGKIRATKNANFPACNLVLKPTVP
jgi:hypothetical protein